MKNLTKDEHANRLVKLYTFKEDMLDFVVNNDLDDHPGERRLGKATKEAKEWMEIQWKAGRKVKDAPHLIIEWYNLQFGTDFTEEQIKKMIALVRVR